MNDITNPVIKNMSPQLLVADIDHSIEFYTKQLGFEIDFRYEDFYSGIVRDGFSIHLKSGIKERKKRRENADFDVEIIFSVNGIETLYEGIFSKSVKIIQPLRDMSYGKEFYVEDPDGNILAFVEQA
jgi:predicted enzyme related to lactoylglutathione lyase